MPSKRKDRGETFGAIRAALRDHALATVRLPSTGRLLLAFEGMPWVGVLEITKSPGTPPIGRWMNVTTVRPY